MNSLHIVNASTAATAASAVAPTAASAVAPTGVPTTTGSSADKADDSATFGEMLGLQLDVKNLLDPRGDALPGEKDKTKSQDEPNAVIDPATLNSLALNNNQAGAQAIPLVAQQSEGKGKSDNQTSATPAARAKSQEHKTAARSLDVAAAPAKDSKATPTDKGADTPILAKAEKHFELPPAPNGDAPQALAALQGAHSASAAPAPDKNLALTLQSPVGSERWNDELGQNVSMLLRGDHSSASLHVTPPDLGPISVHIDLSGNQASINFNVQHADTRHALQNALPHLRDMLADSGISLGQAQVNQQFSGQTSPGDSGNMPRSRSDSGASIGGASDTALRVQTRQIGIVDTFA